VTAPRGERVCAVFAADDAYALPLAVTLRSAQDALAPGSALEATVIDGGLRRASRERVLRALDPERVRVRFARPPDGALRGLRVEPGRISLATYYRLLLARVLSPETSRALYLDCDLLVLGDLARLFALDLGGHLLLAVRDAGVPRFGAHPWPGALGAGPFSPETPYFNAGVLLVDLERWRRERVAERALEHLARHRREVRFWDQDGLNAVLAGGFGELDPRWNQLPQLHAWRAWRENPYGPERCQAALADPWIVHFASAKKPWHFGDAHPERARFFAALDRTAFAGWRPRWGLRDTALARRLVWLRRRTRRLVAGG
jgi:lipopolysaccharide biosynthesis glycosyltransferase